MWQIVELRDDQPVSYLICDDKGKGIGIVQHKESAEQIVKEHNNIFTNPGFKEHTDSSVSEPLS